MGDGICPLVRLLIFYGSENRRKKVTEDHGCDFLVVSYCYASFKPSPSQDFLKKEGKLCSRRVRGEKASGDSEDLVAVCGSSTSWVRPWKQSNCAEFI